MTVRPRGTTFIADFMSRGVRYREPFDTFEDAEKWEADAKHALKYGKPVPQPKNQRTTTGGRLDTLGKLRDHVVGTTWDRARGSQAAILYSKQVVDLLGGPNTPVSSVTKLELEKVCNKLFESGNSVATVNRKMSAISKMLTEAVEHGVITKKPKIPKGKELSNQIRFLTPSEEATLEARFIHMGLHDWARFVVLAADTGMRLGEILRLRWDHLGPDWEMLHIWQTKNGKPRTIYCTQRVVQTLQTMQTLYGEQPGPFYHFRDGNLLKRSLREQWDQVTTDCGVDKRIHDLRHTCASRMVQKGVDLLRVKEWLGHSSITTTLRYAHLAPNDLAACKKALEL